MPWWHALDALGFSVVGGLVPPCALPLMLFFSALGSASAVIAQVCLVAAYLLHRGERTFAGGLAASVGLGWLVQALLKVLVHRARPDLPHLVAVGGYAFPSGHAFVTLVLYGYLALLLGRLAPRRVGTRVVLLLLVLVVGVSRVYLGVHYPTDVLGGWVLGAAWLGACWCLTLRAGGRLAPGTREPTRRFATAVRERTNSGRWPGPLTLGLGLLGVAMAASLGIRAGGPTDAASCDLVVAPGIAIPADLAHTVRTLYQARAAGLLAADSTPVEAFYDEDREVGRWAREHDHTRIAHLAAWAAARQVAIEGVQVHVRVALAEVERERAWLEMGVTERITYHHTAAPGMSHSFGVGAWHVMQFVRREGRWLVHKDWFSDPLHEAPVVADGAASRVPSPGPRPPHQPGGPPRAGSPPIEPARAGSQDGTPAEGKYRREAAVHYADRYCGPAAGPDSHYNRDYRDYSYLGGDCANFVSQALSDPEAGGLSTDYTWRYAGGKGTRAWVRAADLVYYLLDSGRATLVGRGRYPEVGPAPDGAVYRLLPGDVIGYEQGGEIRHVSLVVGHDPAGYPLVNSHTGDRYHVPWDLGWDARTVFWLLHITE
ncbi:MAG: amidase domain-containing protein [Firmicutes bacterium]|nr:amidase domain-containing protein [Bacillota bacterium]